VFTATLPNFQETKVLVVDHLRDSIELIVLLTGVETTIGVVDVKSSPVYFHVQRNSTYSLANTTIPFEIERLNVGGGMNITSGIFTAPKSGIYFFSFTGLKSFPANELDVDFFHNSNLITRAFGANIAGSLTATLSSTLSLKSGDQISLRLGGGQLNDDSDHYHTNFNGLLLQEEMLSSSPHST
jgi:C1q-related factor